MGELIESAAIAKAVTERKLNISDATADETFSLIRNGFKKTDSSSLLRQSLTREEFSLEMEDETVTKIFVYDKEGRVVGYGSVLERVRKMSWIDVDTVINGIDIPVGDLLGVGSIVIDEDARVHRFSVDLLEAIGRITHAIYEERRKEGRKFGVIFDCAPINHTLPQLIKHVLDTRIAPSYIKPIGYQTTILVAPKVDRPSTSIDTISITDSPDTIDIEALVDSISGQSENHTLLQLSATTEQLVVPSSEQIVKHDTQRIYLAGYNETLNKAGRRA